MSEAVQPYGARFYDKVRQDLGRAVRVTTRHRLGSTLTILDVIGAEPALARALVLFDRGRLRIHCEDDARTCYVFRWASGYANGPDVRIQGELEPSTGQRARGAGYPERPEPTPKPRVEPPPVSIAGIWAARSAAGEPRAAADWPSRLTRRSSRIRSTSRRRADRSIGGGRDRDDDVLRAGVARAGADGLDGGLQLAAVQEDAVALVAVVDVDGAENSLRRGCRGRRGRGPCSRSGPGAGPTCRSAGRAGDRAPPRATSRRA